MASVDRLLYQRLDATLGEYLAAARGVGLRAEPAQPSGRLRSRRLSCRRHTFTVEAS